MRSLKLFLPVLLLLLASTAHADTHTIVRQISVEDRGTPDAVWAQMLNEVDAYTTLTMSDLQPGEMIIETGWLTMPQITLDDQGRWDGYGVFYWTIQSDDVPPIIVEPPSGN